jgi:hypothetical protein
MTGSTACIGVPEPIVAERIQRTQSNEAKSIKEECERHDID